jgi:uncharacterized protein YjbI with pentapeptide repeats
MEVTVADRETLRLLARGVTAWNQARCTSEVNPDLTEVTIKNSYLRRIDLRGVDFNHSDIEGSDLREADLRDANLNGIRIRASTLMSANLSGANLLGADFWKACLADCDLSKTRSVDLKIRDSVLRKARLDEARLQRAHFHNCDLREVRLAGATMTGSFLKRIRLDAASRAEMLGGGVDIERINDMRDQELANCDQFSIDAEEHELGAITYDGVVHWIGEQRWDFFICHSSEDKDTVAGPLARTLKKSKQRVWLDAHQLGLGDALLDRIDFGISGCKFGVALISRSFFGRSWTSHEIDQMIRRRARIFVVLHGVDRGEVEERYPRLRALFTTSTDKGITTVADELIAAVHRPQVSFEVPPVDQGTS